MTENTFDLKATLLVTEETMKANLGGARTLVEHAPSKGTISEEAWRRVIKKFLPRRYTVSTNVFVVGADGRKSGQIDVAVHDGHFCPLFFEEGGIKFVPAESVFAVFDAKQEISKETIEATQEKIASVRAIRRTNRGIVERGETRPPRSEFDIIGGILALTSGWSELFGKPIHELLTASVAEPGRLDLGCALAEGAFEVRYPDAGGAQLDGATEAPLTFFLMRLFSILQAVGSPMAIDLRVYTESIEAVEEIPAQELASEVNGEV